MYREGFVNIRDGIHGNTITNTTRRYTLMFRLECVIIYIIYLSHFKLRGLLLSKFSKNRFFFT